MDLSFRNTNHDRDINAAINIKQFAINNLIHLWNRGQSLRSYSQKREP